MLLRTSDKTRDDESYDGGLPIPTQIVSNSEFYPIPQTERQRRIERLIREMADERAHALGWSRRRFLQSACGTATALMALNIASGCSDAKSDGGFDVTDCATRDPEAAREVFQPGEYFIVDVQTHHADLEGPIGTNPALQDFFRAFRICAPATEASGRIHTSAVTVAVLPEADEVDVEIDEKDLRIDVFRSSGPGGQSVNTTDSAVRVTHLPTGIVVSCQDEKSQHKNKAKALKILRARLLERAEEEQRAAVAANRKSMVGSGDRSERIRTYNFPQNRVTDHRINLTTHALDRVLEGELELIIEPLVTWHQTEALKAQSA